MELLVGGGGATKVHILFKFNFDEPLFYLIFTNKSAFTEVPDDKKSSIFFNFLSDEPGVFIWQLLYKGRAKVSPTTPRFGK